MYVLVEVVCIGGAGRGPRGGSVCVCVCLCVCVGGDIEEVV